MRGAAELPDPCPQCHSLYPCGCYNESESEDEGFPQQLSAAAWHGEPLAGPSTASQEQYRMAASQDGRFQPIPVPPNMLRWPQAYSQAAPYPRAMPLPSNSPYVDSATLWHQGYPAGGMIAQSSTPLPGPSMMSHARPTTPPPSVLNNVTSETVNSPSRKRGRRGRRGTKRHAPGDRDGDSARKRRRSARAGSDIPVPPADTTEATHRVYGSLVRKPIVPNDVRSQQDATDVWFFVEPAHLTATTPPTPIPQYSYAEPPASLKRPSPEKYNYLICKPCTSSRRAPAQWHLWKNVSGQVDAIRTHLQRYHRDDFEDSVLKFRLKGHEELASRRASSSAMQSSSLAEILATRTLAEKFTVNGFRERLARWVVTDDQSLRVVDNEFFRDLLLYCIGPDRLSSSELQNCIPHRTAFTELIIKLSDERFDKLVDRLKHSLGRVSFTTDVWSDGDLKAFMAITTHCIIREGRKLLLDSQLGALRYIRGRHTGERLAEVFLQVLKDLDVLDKVGMITLDNASNCDTMLEHLEIKLKAMNIPFHREGNRIRCFPHVVNLSVKAGVDVLPDVEALKAKLTAEGKTELSDSEAQFVDALKTDLIKRVREFVGSARVSGLRREDLEAAIEEANERGLFGEGVVVNTTSALLREVDTRWSSIMLMLDRYLELLPALDILVSKDQNADLDSLLLHGVERDVLNTVRLYLDVPFSIQELLAAQHTPTLSHMFPAYKELLDLFKLLRSKAPLLSHAIDASIRKLEDYLDSMRGHRIATLAMLVNPTMKLQRLHDLGWSSSEIEQARDWLRDEMLAHRKAQRSRKGVAESGADRRGQSASSSQPLGRSRSDRLTAESFAAKWNKFTSLRKTLSEADVFGAPLSGTATGGTDQRSESQPVDDREAERLADAEDNLYVEKQLSAFFEEALAPDGTDVLQYWESRESMFDLVFLVAMDVLPVQASAVACERVFSLSSETDTKRRRRLSALLMERLQFLKHSYKQEFGERLNLSTHWGVTRDNPQEFAVSTASSGLTADTLEWERQRKASQQLKDLWDEVDDDPQYQDNDSDAFGLNFAAQ